MSVANYNHNDHRDQERGYTNPAILRDAASKMVHIARRKFRGRDLIFVGQGGSGVSLATACVLACRRRRSYMVATHRNYTLASEIRDAADRLTNPAVVFVDDYIFNGSTLKKVIANCKKKKVKIDLAITIEADSWTVGKENKEIEGVPVKTLR